MHSETPELRAAWIYEVDRENDRATLRFCVTFIARWRIFPTDELIDIHSDGRCIRLDGNRRFHFDVFEDSRPRAHSSNRLAEQKRELRQASLYRLRRHQKSHQVSGLEVTVGHQRTADAQHACNKTMKRDGSSVDCRVARTRVTLIVLMYRIWKFNNLILLLTGQEPPYLSFIENNLKH